MTISAEQFARDSEELLRRAAQGEEIVILERGSPVARLLPVSPPPVRRLPWSLAELKEWRKGNVLGPDLSVDQLIAEARGE